MPGIIELLEYLNGKGLFVAIDTNATKLKEYAADLVRIGKIAENSVDYSIQNTTRQALFLPTSRDAKYKAVQELNPDVPAALCATRSQPSSSAARTNSWAMR